MEDLSLPAGQEGPERCGGMEEGAGAGCFDHHQATLQSELSLNAASQNARPARFAVRPRLFPSWEEEVGRLGGHGVK